MLQALPYLLSYIFPLLLVLAARWNGAWTWAVPIVLGLLVLLERLLGQDLREIGESDEDAEHRTHLLFSWMLWLHVPVQYAVVIYVLERVAHQPMLPIHLLGLLLSTGVVSGMVGINVAHELVHRRSKWEQLLGQLLLLKACYLHFFIEHIRGHHRRVGTYDDPSTARLGESFWSYLPRVVGDSLSSAWLLEAERLRRQNRSTWSHRNLMLQFLAATLALCGAVLAAFGLSAFLFFLVSSMIAFTLLEATNYIEHYGLERPGNAQGRLVDVAAEHSWNTNHRLGRWLLFELTRHSDHHLHASLPYQRLHGHPDAPQLPAGYFAMIATAMVPPVWHAMMDPLARSWRARTLGIDAPEPDLPRRWSLAGPIVLAGALGSVGIAFLDSGFFDAPVARSPVPVASKPLDTPLEQVASQLESERLALSVPGEIPDFVAATPADGSVMIAPFLIDAASFPRATLTVTLEPGLKLPRPTARCLLDDGEARQLVLEPVAGRPGAWSAEVPKAWLREGYNPILIAPKGPDATRGTRAFISYERERSIFASLPTTSTKPAPVCRHQPVRHKALMVAHGRPTRLLGPILLDLVKTQPDCVLARLQLGKTIHRSFRGRLHATDEESKEHSNDLTAQIASSDASLRDLLLLSMRQFNEALRINRKTAGSWMRYGIWLIKMQDYPSALQACRMALLLGPADGPAWGNLAMAMFGELASVPKSERGDGWNDQHALAVACAREGVKRVTLSRTCWLPPAVIEGALLELAGNRDEAREAFGSAVRTLPKKGLRAGHLARLATAHLELVYGGPPPNKKGPPTRMQQLLAMLEPAAVKR